MVEGTLERCSSNFLIQKIIGSSQSQNVRLESLPFINKQNKKLLVLRFVKNIIMVRCFPLSNFLVIK